MEVDGKKGSRFSTLRVFKFSRNSPPIPPPPPPKDPVYLAARNRSLASLSPESNPGSPLSVDQYQYNPSASAVSLVLPTAPPKRKRSGLFKFATVSKKSAENSPVQDDENISMPWNFQHNVHVDEAFAGLPPSWTTSLQEAGFSDDEIAAIQQRRLADRPRERPISPAVLRPGPRTTSLPKSATYARLVVECIVHEHLVGQLVPRPRAAAGFSKTTISPTRLCRQAESAQCPSTTARAAAVFGPRAYVRFAPVKTAVTTVLITSFSFSAATTNTTSLIISTFPISLSLSLTISGTRTTGARQCQEPYPRPCARGFRRLVSYSGRLVPTAPPQRTTISETPQDQPARNSPIRKRQSYLGMTPSPSPSPTAQTFGLSPSSRDRDNRDSGMSDSTMLGIPPSAGHCAQSQHCAQGGCERGRCSSRVFLHLESQDHQTPTTELADEEEGYDGKLDYYLEGRSYLAGNGFKLDSGRHRRGQSQEEQEEDEEERRRREWEDMQRRATEKKRPDARAEMMVSATDTFGGPAEEEEEEDEEEGYGYGYGFEPPNEGDGADVSPLSPPEYESPLRSPLREYAAEEEEEEEEDEEGTLGPKQRAALGLQAAPPPTRPTGHHYDAYSTLTGPPHRAWDSSQTPITPAKRYAGWVAAAVAPLEDFIDEPIDPRDFYCDLQEIAEGESGSARDAEDVAAWAAGDGGDQERFAGSGGDAQACGRAARVLGLDALYVDLMDDALWIRMELMERSLADVVGLVDAGLRIQEPRVLARFASDMLQALDYLQKHGIAHRDLRSDNLLLNSQGVLKLTDFSNAVLVTPEEPLATEPAGVLFWQAPEVRSGSYDPLKIDVWSVGATIWELAEANPPFA
ncbi:hypothetical protein FB45DRAFT_1135466 [Roridomyces roridus]|uniref:Non-specific serine/threonine protein kinase n=1 Tax=Roridomyces roridus TaxID=1738132 RepID=A0AAD7B1S8_9AGAR|nr:hypothetical protein FB45DRAFT_1135466 [Roridomyces roridus]